MLRCDLAKTGFVWFCLEWLLLLAQYETIYYPNLDIERLLINLNYAASVEAGWSGRATAWTPTAL